MKVRRDVNSLPIRSADETWQVIIGLITGGDSQHQTDLTAVAGVVASVITDEQPARQPFIVSGAGHRLVIYCQFGSNALTEDENAAPLQWNPTAGDWHLRIPCDSENLKWVKAALARKSTRITAYDVEAHEDDETAESNRAGTVPEIDWTPGDGQ